MKISDGETRSKGAISKIGWELKDGYWWKYTGTTTYVKGRIENGWEKRHANYEEGE